VAVVTSFPKQVREIETLWIPLADGARLAARLWLPEDAERRPVPAILEYLPYRRRDGTRDGDDERHAYFAGHGYAAIRVDIRGSGDSDGVITDEYLKQEQDDALEVIAWIAQQSWCSGAVGMIGISWGGFNGLQVAARRPPALKAIISACSTDDRYADDMHYMGGAVLTDTHAWGASFFGRMNRSPDPASVGAQRWREMWLERLNAAYPPFVTWLRHQRRDAYWKHGSVCENPAAIEAAVMLVGGWADGYCNAIFRMLRHLRCPRLAIVGPWGHKMPYNGVPGPAIGFLQEAVRWWDHWLKARASGIMSAPRLRAYIQDAVPPRAHYDERPGRWVAEPSWPSPNIESRQTGLGEGRLGDGLPAARSLVSSPLTTGSGGGEWCPYGMGGLGPEMPLDQREDDGRSLIFDGELLTEQVEILGAPVVTLTLESDQPAAMLAVRLNDVAPDGASTRVTYGVLNLTHRNSHEAPEPLVPGAIYTVMLQLNEVGYAFPAGHRLRLAVSTAYWPMAWPSPLRVTLAIHTAGSSLTLPVRARRAEDAAVHFAPASAAPPPKRTATRPGEARRTIERDLATGESIYTVVRDDGASIIDAIGIETQYRKVVRYMIRDHDPASARMEIEQRYVNGSTGWNSCVETNTTVACSAENFMISARLRALEGEQEVFSRTWSESIRRDLV
jgi:putative CocE/NonD family hydrolase